MSVGYFVIPCYNEEECLVLSIKRLISKLYELIKLGKISKNSRIVFVDDGSKDDTWKIITEYARKDTHIIGIKMAHNVGHQSALLAGLSYANSKSDFIITIDADLQQDINAFIDFISEYEKGNDIVFGIRNSRNTDSLLKKITALSFYKMMKLMGTEVIKNHADYRLLSHKACQALLEYHESNLFLRGLVVQLGFKSSKVYFDVTERIAGESKYSNMKMLKFAIDGITSMSIMPLHIIALMGITVSLIGVILVIFFVASWIHGKTIQGWTSILCSLWILSGLILFGVGICGEYIGKNYIESKRRPRYYIEQVIGGVNK